MRGKDLRRKSDLLHEEIELDTVQKLGQVCRHRTGMVGCAGLRARIATRSP